MMTIYTGKTSKLRHHIQYLSPRAERESMLSSSLLTLDSVHHQISARLSWFGS